MARDKRSIEAGLMAKGFSKDSGRDHNYFYYHRLVDGTKTGVLTKTSHGRKGTVLSDGLIAQMSRQCCLSRKQFLELLDCPLSRADYERILEQAGIPTH